MRQQEITTYAEGDAGTMKAKDKRNYLGIKMITAGHDALLFFLSNFMENNIIYPTYIFYLDLLVTCCYNRMRNKLPIRRMI